MRLLAGRYRLEEKISSGKTGGAYRAIDEETGRDVAVKTYDSDVVGEDIKEVVLKKARATSALTHPNVTTVHDFGVDDGTPFVVMELVEGIDLVHLLDQEEPLAPSRAIYIHGQIVAALQHSRSAGVAHGPVRPENVIIGKQDKVNVTLPLGLSNTAASTDTNMTEPLRRSLEALASSGGQSVDDIPLEEEKNESQTIWPIPGGRYDPTRLGRRVILVLVLLALAALGAFIWRVTSEVEERRENPPSITPSVLLTGAASGTHRLGASRGASSRVTLLASDTEDDGVSTSDATGAEPVQGTGTDARVRVTITLDYEGVGDGALFDRGLKS